MIRDPQYRDLGPVWITSRDSSGNPTGWGRSGPTGRKMPQREVAAACYCAGWKDPKDLAEIVAIVYAESGGREHARLVYTDAQGTPLEPYRADEGPFQLHNRYLPAGTTAEEIYTLASAAKLAYQKYVDAGRSFKPWAAWTNGGWKKYKRVAVKGVANWLADVYHVKRFV